MAYTHEIVATISESPCLKTTSYCAESINILVQNLYRGRGLFCQSVMKSQVASPSYTAVFAALVAVIGTRLPDIPTLLVHRLIAQFKRAFKRNDRALTSSVVTFLCHLANQLVSALCFIESELGSP